MPFPDRPRVIYSLNPLEAVICQLKFPSVLRIDSEPPAAFQDRIRHDYPGFVETRGVDHVLPAQLVKLLGASLPVQVGRSSYEFTSEDENWNLSLTRDFLALTCKKYDRWENFKAHLAGAVTALIDVYGPAFFTRVGLRYRDVVRRSKLGLADVDWVELLQPHIAGELTRPEIRAEIRHIAKELVVGLPNDVGLVRILHGLGHVDDDEDVYLIDSDYFTDQKTECHNVHSILDGFNAEARRIFRWVISDRLHDAMEPRQL